MPSFALTQVEQFLAQHDSIAQVRFVCFGETADQCYRETRDRLTQ